MLLNFFIYFFCSIGFCSDCLNNANSIQLDSALSIPYERVITLGGNCVTKAQVNFYFEKRYPGKSKDYTGGGYLFDWCVPTDLLLFVTSIRNSFEGVCDQSMKVINLPWNKAAVGPIDNYKIIFSHLFANHPTLTHNNPFEPAENRKLLDQEEFDLKFNDVFKKISYLKKKTFFNIASEKLNTLFVFSENQFVSGFDSNSIRLIRDAIYEKRRAYNFVLLIVFYSDYNFIDFENIIFRKIKPWSWPEWIQKGIPQWEELLDQFHFTPIPYQREEF